MIVSISGKIGSGKDTVAKIWQFIDAGYNKDVIIDTIINRDKIIDYNLLPFSDESSWEVRKFADKLKETIAMWLGVPRAKLEDDKFKNTILPKEWDKYIVYNWGRVTDHLFTTEAEAQVYCDTNNTSQTRLTWKRERMTVRKLMLLLGTEAGRDIIHPNIWINIMFSDWHPTQSFSEWSGISKEDITYYWEQKKLKSVEWYKATTPKWLITDCRFPNELAAVLERGGLAIRVNRRRRVNDNQVLEKAIDYLDLVNPNPDAIQEIARRMDLEWDEREEKWIDTLGLFNLTHESETALDSTPFPVVIENEGSLEDLYNQLLPIYEEVCNQKT